MFDFNWSEFALIGVVALLVIGPKDMPVAIRAVTNMIKKGRKLAGEFQSHFDEMVREADLGEARDGLRQLRSFNVRGQVMRAMDGDGSLRRTLQEKPLADFAAPAGPRQAPSSTETSTATMTERPAWQATDLSPAGSYGGTAEPPPGDEEAAAADPAPSILPPQHARRLRAERARPQPPAFLPPNALRPFGH